MTMNLKSRSNRSAITSRAVFLKKNQQNRTHSHALPHVAGGEREKKRTKKFRETLPQSLSLVVKSNNQSFSSLSLNGAQGEKSSNANLSRTHLQLSTDVICKEKQPNNDDD